MSVIEHQAERVGKYQPYPEYNNSGYSWMAKIPSGWLNGPLKRIAYLQAGFAFKGDTFNTSEGVPIVRMNNILNSGGLSLDDAVRVPEIDVKPEFYLATGDIVMGMSGSIENIAKVQGDDLPCALNQRVGRFVLRAVDDGFLWYLIQSNGFKQQVSLAATGTAQLNISSDQVGNTLVSWPVSLLEQNIIAAFLDYETARIDRLIAKQQRLIELLKEKRQALISHAVTKGLNPNTPMKDSGVEWLGQVPEHWNVTKFGFISNVVRGGSPRPAGDPELFDGDYSPWVTVAEITKDEEVYLESTESFLTEKGSKQSRVFKRGTLLLSNSGATLGVPKILSIDANANDGVVGFEKLSVNTEYAYFYLSTLTDNLRERIKQGSGQPNLNTDIVKSIVIPLPPSGEVEAILSEIKTHRITFSVLISKADTAIKLMQERRTALISAAVTGKIDLRGWTQPAEEVAA
ncbi:restriction endonuclease subunit S [Aeromonas caviae]|nr:restriction endonuclease subunit S [Aeromonas caviae]